MRLTVQPSFMREALVKQLADRSDLALFNFDNSAYFKRYICLSDVSLRNRRKSFVKARNLSPLLASSYSQRKSRMSTLRSD